MLRLFFAVELPESLKRAAGRLQTSVKGESSARVAWVRPETLHLTLRFLGDRPATVVPGLLDAARRGLAPLPPFTVLLAGGGAFHGGRQRPRVLWLGTRSEGALERSAQALEAALREAGEPPEERPFRSHLTIGRVKSGDARPVAAILAAAEEVGRFPVTEVVLFQSELHPTGAVHTPLGHAPLTGQP